MERARTLGLVLIGIGLMELAWVVFCVGGGLLLGLTGFIDDAMGPMLWIGGGAYFVLALVNTPIALLHLFAGSRLRQGRGLVLAIAAVAAGMVSLVFALYCSPFTLAGMIYAIIVLADADVRKVLDDGDAG